jgi:hypothetical protein
MNGTLRFGFVAFAVALSLAPAAEIKVDFGKEQPGKSPTTFEPIFGTWVIAQDGPDKVIMVDGRPWVASKDNPRMVKKLDLLESDHGCGPNGLSWESIPKRK